MFRIPGFRMTGNRRTDTGFRQIESSSPLCYSHTMKLCLRKALTLGLFLLAATFSPAESAVGEAGIWEKAVACRARSFTMAPGELPYEQYQLDRDGSVAHREIGCMGISYDTNGKAAISIIWASRDDKDFTAERAKRLEKQASRRNEFLSFITPFDPDVQDKLQRKPGEMVFAEGKTLWQYEFSLPINEDRGIVGTARVDDSGIPYDLRYTLSPLPWFLDIIDMHVVFHADGEHLLFRSLDYKFEASFLFWLWRGGGNAAFNDWKRISAPPRLD